MNTSLSMTQPNGPEALVQSLIATLDDERDALRALGLQFQSQLDLIRAAAAPNGEEVADTASEVIARLGQLRAARERQTRLLRRVLRLDEDASLTDLTVALGGHAVLHTYGASLGRARTSVQAEARQTRRACEELDFALRYAAELGREMIQTMHDQLAPAGPQTYTSAGRTARPASRSLLNQIG